MTSFGPLPTLRKLPCSLKALFTSYLLVMGVGYAMSLFYLFLMDVDPHRKMGMSSVAGVIHKYYGRRDVTKLESALRGTMSEYVRAEERDQILEWIRTGAQRESYPKIEPILLNNCAVCHDKGAIPPPTSSYEDALRLTVADRGASILQLARVSHVHLFGIAFLFFLSGLIFCLAELREGIKIVVVSMPFAAMFLDILSWWLTKYQPLFAYTVLGGGALMSLGVPIQILIPLHQMWILPRRNPSAPPQD